MSVGKTLKLMRTATGISQAELARRVGASASYLCLVEGERRKPSLPFLESIAKQFKIPAGFLLLQDVDMSQLKRSQRKLVGDIRQDLVQYIAMELGRDSRKKSSKIPGSSRRTGQ